MVNANFPFIPFEQVYFASSDIRTEANYLNKESIHILRSEFIFEILKPDCKSFQNSSLGNREDWNTSKQAAGCHFLEFKFPRGNICLVFDKIITS